MIKQHLEYLVTEIGDGSSGKVGLFDGHNNLMVVYDAFLKYKLVSMQSALNLTSPIIVWSFENESEAMIVLSGLYERGYKLVSHVAYIADGQAWQTVILHKQPRGAVDM